jgi:hypothetical protein
MADTYYFVKDLINDLERGRVRIPSFQRGFVWEAERVSYFIDSIYKGFPFGSVLLWRTKNPLKTERNLGPYKLRQNDPEYPIDYVLDGQQRITSIFGIFQNSINPNEGEETSWTNLFFALNSKESVPFCYLDDSQNYDPNSFFPLKYVFDAPKYRQLTRNLDENLASQIDDLVERFTKARIPLERFESEEPKYVATVFERINRQGIDLDTFQLLSVWNWSEDFDLQVKFSEISEELESFGFKEVGSDLLLKCCSAVIMCKTDPKDFLELPGSAVRDKFEEIKRGIFGAIDFLKSELNVFSLKLLPMENILPVLTYFFSSSQKQSSPIPQQKNEVIKKWFWRSCFSQRYARGNKISDIDLSEFKNLKSGNFHKLGEFDLSLEQSFFIKNTFLLSSVATRTFILLLAQGKPLNFIQGTNIALEKVLSQSNRKEFHHIFPKAYLEKSGKYDAKQINCLANFSILARTDNNKINNKAPSIYKNEMPPTDQKLREILSTHFCPVEMFNDNYDNFLNLRAKLLLEKAQTLCQILDI